MALRMNLKQVYFALVLMGLMVVLGSCANGPEKVEIIPHGDGPVLAFPGVEGGGSYTSGGRGGDVYIVTNLEDYDPNSEEPIEGSLRNGILSTPEEGRTIVFNVSGTIELQSTLLLAGVKNLTIAGQTAPGNGITLAGWDTNISKSENIIIRYMSFRPGATNVFNGSDSMDAMWGRDNNHFVIDHCSFSWNTDETMSLYRGENGTIQWSIMSESLTLSGHSKGRHGYGGIVGGDNTTFHHNLYISHTSRNPRLSGGYNGKADKDHMAVIDFSNNVIYNWGFNNAYGGRFGFSNFVNNYEVAGPGTRDNVLNQVINPGEKGKMSGFYIKGNVLNGTYTDLLDETSPYVKNSGVLDGDNPVIFKDTPYLSADSTGVNAGITNQAFDDYITAQVVPADEDLYDSILKQAGATYPRRDAIDARVVNEVVQGLGRYINTENEVGGYVSPFGKVEDQHSSDYDQNQNGIADAWEVVNGIDQDPEAYKTVTPNGYTWLEIYLNGLVSMYHEATNPVVELVSPAPDSNYSVGTDIPVSIKVSADNKIDHVDIYNGSQLVGTATPKGGNYTYSLKGLEDGIYYISSRVTDTKGNATQSTASIISVNNDPATVIDAGWVSTDIGTPDLEGTASYRDDVLTVKGNGKLGASEGSDDNSPEGDATQDDFHFVYREFVGDMEIIAKLESIGSVDNHAFTGLMIRDSLETNSAVAALGLSWVKISKDYCWSAYLAQRASTGGDMNDLSETLDSPSKAEAAGIALVNDVPFKIKGVEQGYWMKLIRKGDVFQAFGSEDGNHWVLIGERTISMDGSVFVGFAVDSNDVANEIEQLNYAKFSHIEINH